MLNNSTQYFHLSNETLFNTKTSIMKQYSLIILFFFSIFITNAQDSNPYKNIIPPNPDAASLAKYADYPVDLSTGVVNVNIPLWEIKCGSFSLPISLSYHASGIPVAETPSYVGLGWALNAGGAITRTIRGNADDGMERHSGTNDAELLGILNQSDYYAINSNSQADNYNPRKYRDAALGKLDLEPDLFYFNFCNLSGKFVFDFSGTPHLIPKRNIKIEKVQNSGNGNSRIINWIITNEDGIKYYFDAYEKTDQNIIMQEWLPNGSNLKASSIAINYTTTEENSAWFLTKIELPNSSKQILFDYDDIVTENKSPTSESLKRVNSMLISGTFQCNWDWDDIEKKIEADRIKEALMRVDGSNSYSETQTTSTIYGKRLKTITTPDQTIEFIPGIYRHDLKGDRVLDKVVIKDNQGSIIKKFLLSYNYFSENSMTTPSTIANANTEANTKLRLSLKNIYEIDKYGNYLPPHTFKYESAFWLPDRLTSKAKDHWGYYNGENLNTSLFPYLGAIRDASATNMKAGCLTEIDYPTGGNTQFEFESNYYKTGTSRSWNSISAYCEVGACVYDNTNNSFSISDDVSGKATVTIRLTGNYGNSYNCGSCNAQLIDPNNPNTYIYLAIEGPNGTTRFPQEFSINGKTTGMLNLSESRILTNGNYKIKAQKTTDGVNFYDISSCEASPYYRIRFSVEGLQQKSYTGAKPTGGLRIAKKTDFDPVKQTKLIKEYDYNSSGYVSYTPNYEYFTEKSGVDCPFELYAGYHYYTSTSNTALNNGGEQIINYEKVTVTESDDQNHIFGKTENEYTLLNSQNSLPVDNSSPSYTIPTNINNTIGNGNVGKFPFAPQISGGWGSGLLKSQIFYKSDNNNYRKIRKLENTYKNDYNGKTYEYNATTDVLAAKSGISYTKAGAEDNLGIVSVQLYYIPSRNIDLVKTEETEYDENENPTISKATSMNYNSIHQISENITTNSAGDTLKTKIKYPVDYTYYNGFIKAMIDKNMLSYPIEELSLKNGNVINATHYRYTATTSPLLSGIYKTETSQPITENSFYGLDDLGNLIPYTHYKENLIFDRYDTYGNLLQYHGKDNKYISFLWSYSNTYPIAKIENATYDQVSNAITGTINTITSSDNPSDADIQTMASTLRNNLPNAQITAYTYQPLLGMTTTIDPRGVKTFFSYDNWGRLRTKLDNNSNLIQYYNYHYANESSSNTSVTTSGNSSTISTSINSYNAPATENVTTFTLQASTSWTIENSNTWMSVYPSTGTTNATITLIVHANTSSNSRSGIIDIICGNTTKKIIINQSGI